MDSFIQEFLIDFAKTFCHLEESEALLLANMNILLKKKKPLMWVHFQSSANTDKLSQYYQKQHFSLFFFFFPRCSKAITVKALLGNEHYPCFRNEEIKVTVKSNQGQKLNIKNQRKKISWLLKIFGCLTRTVHVWMLLNKIK